MAGAAGTVALMAAFEYIAFDSRGKRLKGVLEAGNVRQIRRLLRDQGLFPIGVNTAAQTGLRASGGFMLLELLVVMVVFPILTVPSLRTRLIDEASVCRTRQSPGA